MKDSAATEELDSCGYLYLEGLSEPHVNGLRLVLSEGIVSDQSETLTVGDIEIPDVRPIEVTDASRWFEVVWDTYISYSVRNESYCSWGKDEEWSGNAFRVYSRSTFLEFVSTGTFASAEYPGPFVHYEILCSDHIIDVASESPPTVRRVGAQQFIQAEPAPRVGLVQALGLMRRASGLLTLIFGVVFWYASWRNTSCGYDCGILDTQLGGSGPAVVIVWLLSFWALIGSLFAFLVAIFLHWRATSRPN